MKRFYGVKGYEEDGCYPLEVIQEALDEQTGWGGIPLDAQTVELTVWEPKTGTGTFWCDEHNEGFESSDDSCGKFKCDYYVPRNGKNGRCRHHKTPHFPTEKTIVIRKSVRVGSEGAEK